MKWTHREKGLDTWVCRSAEKVQADEAAKEDPVEDDPVEEDPVEEESIENPFFDEEDEEAEEALPEPVGVLEENVIGEADDLESEKDATVDMEVVEEDVGDANLDKSDDVEAVDREGSVEEDMLELEVNPAEFKDLAGVDSTTDGSKAVEVVKEDEDIEIIEHVVTAKKKKFNDNVKKPEQTPVVPTLPSPVSVQKPKASTSNGTKAAVSESPVAISEISLPVVEEEEVEVVKAKLVQFRKSSSVMKRGKVEAGVLEVLEGEHKGRTVTFQASATYAWGHHLVQANLMYHLRLGELLLVQLLEAKGSLLLAKRVWLGSRKVPEQEDSGDGLEMRAWLLERSLSQAAFQQWVRDVLPPKPFFPLKSEQFEAKVIMLIRENPKGDGALVRITTDGNMKDDLVVFERDDFYLCGVHLGEADMRFLLRPGDQVKLLPPGAPYLLPPSLLPSTVCSPGDGAASRAIGEGEESEAEEVPQAG